MTADLAPSTSSTVADRVASSSLSLVIRRISVLTTTAASTAIIARALDTDDYGQLQSALAVWAIVLAVVEFGFGPVLSREFAAQAEHRPALLRIGKDLQGVLGLLGTLGFVVTALVIGVDTQQGLMYLCLAPSMAFAGYSGGRSLFLALFETKRLIRIDVTIAVLQCVAVAAVALWTHDPVLVALVTGVAMAANTAWVGIAAQRRVGPGRRRREMYPSFVRQVLPLGFTSVVSKIYLSIDLVILAWMAGDTEVAYYAGAVKIVAFLNTLTGLVVSAALPGLSSLRDDVGALLRLTGRLISWLSVTVLPCFVICAIFAQAACQVVLGGKFDGAAPLLVVLILAGVVAAASQIFGAVLTSVSVVKPMLYQNLFAVAVNVVGNILLIPHIGAVACAAMTVVTECIVCGGSLWTLMRKYPLREQFAVAVRPAVGTAIAAALGIPFTDQPLIGIPLSLATLAIAFRLLRCWPVELPLPFLRAKPSGL